MRMCVFAAEDNCQFILVCQRVGTSFFFRYFSFCFLFFISFVILFDKIFFFFFLLILSDISRFYRVCTFFLLLYSACKEETHVHVAVVRRQPFFHVFVINLTCCYKNFFVFNVSSWFFFLIK